MKRQLRAFIAVICAISLTSCGDSSGDDEAVVETPPTVKAETVAQIAQPQAPQADLSQGPPSFDDALIVVGARLDIESPIPGAKGALQVSSVKADSAVISWTKASDNKSSKKNLRYQVYYSTNDNIKTVAQAELNGMPYENFKKNADSIQLQLAEGQTYFVNVVVKDESDNIAAYKSVSLTTKYFPVPGNSGAIEVSQTGADVDVMWTQALNGGTSTSADLRYSLYTSSQANMSSLGDVLANGTLIGSAEEISSMKILQPGPSTRLFINVVVEDIHGNLAAYDQTTIDTSSDVYVSYVDLTNRDVKFVKYKENTWQEPVIVASAGDFYRYQTSIQVDAQDAVHMSFYEDLGRDLWYASDASGEFVATIASATGLVGSYSSLALSPDGDPYIAAYDATNTDLSLYFAYGAGWAQQPAFASTNAVGIYTSLDLDKHGDAHIASYDNSARDLLYSTNVSGLWETVAIDTAGDVGSYGSLKVDHENNIHISYYDATNRRLKYATNLSGEWVTVDVDSSGQQGLFTSLDVGADGQVFIS